MPFYFSISAVLQLGDSLRSQSIRFTLFPAVWPQARSFNTAQRGSFMCNGGMQKNRTCSWSCEKSNEINHFYWGNCLSNTSGDHTHSSVTHRFTSLRFSFFFPEEINLPPSSPADRKQGRDVWHPQVGSLICKLHWGQVFTPMLLQL